VECESVLMYGPWTRANDGSVLGVMMGFCTASSTVWDPCPIMRRFIFDRFRTQSRNVSQIDHFPKRQDVPAQPHAVPQQPYITSPSVLQMSFYYFLSFPKKKYKFNHIYN